MRDYKLKGFIHVVGVFEKEHIIGIDQISRISESDRSGGCEIYLAGNPDYIFAKESLEQLIAKIKEAQEC